MLKKMNISFGVATLLAAFCAGELFAATVTTADGVVTIDVPSGENYKLSDSDVSALTSCDLQKTGVGRLIISTDLKTEGWDGEIVVKAGYLRTTLNGALGGVTKGTVIESGATLEIEVDKAGNSTNVHDKEPYTIGGAGVGGCGAVYAINKGQIGRAHV